MRQLRLWADLSYRQLERRADAAGDVLPRTTLAGALNRPELPREELLASFVRACGGDEDMVGAWVKARRRLAVEPENPSAVVPVRPTAAGAPAHSVEEGPGHGAGAVEVKDDSQPAGASTGTVPEEHACSGTDHASTVSVPTATHAAAAATPDPSTDDGDLALPQPEASKTAEEETTPARVVPLHRRPKLVLGASAVILLVTAAITGISLFPDDDTGKSPAPATHTPTPSTTSSTPPASASSTPSTKPTSQNKLAPGPAGHASPGSTPRTTPSAPTTSKRPSDGPAPQPSHREPTVYEPPPPVYTPPPSQSEDPFPEETCWDVTNDCL
ncbi:hypothetical protein [Streptomyces sp. BE133]|uniref:hypothetical protein n=1 Tax=Streptomyces sp. BE133 TaxID=3002523 RepID=UPI002E76C4DA|nr:hypothetical protein [Streptomyces sp. BE133]MEE1805248.1 hypothetical protein [Streptomyces sp. BE133]